VIRAGGRRRGAQPDPEAGASRDATGRASLRQTVSLVRPAGRRLGFTIALGAGAAGSGVALLATSAWLISRAAQRPSVVALGLAIIGVRFFAISRAVWRYAERLVGHDTALRILADLRVRVYERLERLAPAGLPAFRSGDLLARLVQDVDAVQDLFLRVIAPWGVALLVGVPTVALFWYFLPSAGLIVGLGLLTAGTVVPWLSRLLAERREARQAAARGELSSGVVDLIEGAPELLAFGATETELARLSRVDAELTGIATASARTTGTGTGLITLVTGLTVWGVLLVGVPATVAGRLPGPLLAVIALTPLALFETVAGLPAAAQCLARARRSAARILEVMDAPPPVPEPERPERLGAGPHHLRLRGVSARYHADGPWVLDGIDLDLPPGRRVGIVGPSGSGKSTLAGVLLRLVPYQSGTASVDGIELRALAGDDVRQVVGLAAQDSHLFDTTMRENLLLARRHADEPAIRQALEHARLLAWVEQLPRQLDTEVGEHGARLSGGQRQRLAVARMYLADFPVAILDEPGEHLDTASADALTADLVDLARGRTTVLISHRLAGMEGMDEVLVLDAGQVIERGNHAELLTAGGAYAAQWQRERRVDDEMAEMGALL
jgi:thiol reductant ABC exporter CydC subunit